MSIEIPDGIKKLYDAPGRHYHNLDHVDHMLRLIPQNHPHMEKLICASWFHDAVYNPRAGNGANEMESIQLWEEYAEKQGGRLKEMKNIVSLMIYCTIKHNMPNTPLADPSYTELVQRFLDMDMDILASSRSEYLDYAQKVRREYSHFNDADFRAGRIQFLNGELKKERIFLLEENNAKNKTAFENMKAELILLER